MDDGIRLGGVPVFSSAYGLYDLRFIGGPGSQGTEIATYFTAPLIFWSLFFLTGREKFCKYDKLIAVMVRDDETAPPREGKTC